jgi:hypothetical protein
VVFVGDHETFAGESQNRMHLTELRKELEDAIPNPDEILPLATLGQLLYLTTNLPG